MEQNEQIRTQSLIRNKLLTQVAPLVCPPTVDRGRYVDLNYMRSVAMKAKNTVIRTYSDPTTDTDKHLIKRSIFDANASRKVKLDILRDEISPPSPQDDTTSFVSPTSSMTDLASSDESLSKRKLRRSFGKRPDTFQNLLQCSTENIVDSFTGEKVGLSVDSICGEDLAKKDEQRASLAALNKLPNWESTSLTLNATPAEGRSRENVAAPRNGKPKSILVRKRLRRCSSFPENIHHNPRKGVKFALTSCNFVSCPSHVFPTEPYAVAFDMPFEDSDDELIDYPKPPSRSAQSLPPPSSLADTKVITSQPQLQQHKLLRELEGQVSSPPNGARYIIVDSNPDDCLHCLRLTKDVVKCCTCVWCVQASCYHCCTKDDVGDDRDWLDNFGSCKGTREQNCKRWGALGAMSLVLPCLLLYPPIMGIINACMRCCKSDADENADICSKRT